MSAAQDEDDILAELEAELALDSPSNATASSAAKGDAPASPATAAAHKADADELEQALLDDAAAPQSPAAAKASAASPSAARATASPASAAAAESNGGHAATAKTSIAAAAAAASPVTAASLVSSAVAATPPPRRSAAPPVSPPVRPPVDTSALEKQLQAVQDELATQLTSTLSADGSASSGADGGSLTGTVRQLCSYASADYTRLCLAHQSETSKARTAASGDDATEDGCDDFGCDAACARVPLLASRVRARVWALLLDCAPPPSAAASADDAAAVQAPIDAFAAVPLPDTLPDDEHDSAVSAAPGASPPLASYSGKQGRADRSAHKAQLALIHADCVRTRAGDAQVTRAHRERLSAMLQFAAQTSGEAYRQGLGDVAVPFATAVDGSESGQLLPLAEAYALFQAFVSRHLACSYTPLNGSSGESPHHQSSSSPLSLLTVLWQQLLAYHEPKLAALLTADGVPPALLITEFLLTLFTRRTDLKLLTAFLDLYLVDAPGGGSASSGASSTPLHLCLCVALLAQSSARLSRASSEQLPVLLRGLRLENAVRALHAARAMHDATPQSFKRQVASLAALCAQASGGSSDSDGEVRREVAQRQAWAAAQPCMTLELSELTQRAPPPPPQPSADGTALPASSAEAAAPLKYLLLDARLTDDFSFGHVSTSMTLAPQTSLRDSIAAAELIERLRPLQGLHLALLAERHESYDASVRPAVQRALKATGQALPSRRPAGCWPVEGTAAMVPTFTVEPFDGVGAQLCPCNIATATPQAFTVASRPATSPSPEVPPTITPDSACGDVVIGVRAC